MERDCCFRSEDGYFRYRAAAIIIENGCVLMAGNETADYYYSVGGGVHLGETAEEAVVREVLEETGIRYEIDRLAFIHEDFYDGDGAAIGLRCHEVAFYFLMKPRGSQKLNSNSVCSEGREFMHWIPLDKLEKYKAFPAFFAQKLQNIPAQAEHIVTVE